VYETGTGSPAALAFAVKQDVLDDARVCNKGDDAHACAASSEQRVYFEDFSEQAHPGAACFPGEVEIVLLGAYVCRRSGAVADGDPGPVGIGAVKALAMSSRIGDVGGDAVNPLQGIDIYKHFYPGVQEEIGGAREEMGEDLRHAAHCRAACR